MEFLGSCLIVAAWIVCDTRIFLSGYNSFFHEAKTKEEKALTRKTEAGFTIASYRYPYELLPEYHTALYQLLVGVEQRHPQENLDAYAKQLRELADKVFIDLRRNDGTR